MSDAVLLAAMPIAVSVVLVWLRRQRPAFWWGSLFVYVAIATLFILFRTTDWQIAVGGLLIYVLPVSAMFLGLRPQVFQRKRWLIPPVGIVLYLLGIALSLSINVSAGLIQP